MNQQLVRGAVAASLIAAVAVAIPSPASAQEAGCTAPAPKKPSGIVLGEDLSRLSVAELEQRLVALRAEIERLTAEQAAKKAHEAAAAALFKR